MTSQLMSEDQQQAPAEPKEDPTGRTTLLLAAILIFGIFCSGTTAFVVGTFNLHALQTALLGAAAIAQAIFAGFALLGVRHAQRSADAATATLEIQRKTAMQQLRAYISAKEQKILRVEAGKRPRATIEFHNNGSTPATNVKQWSNFVLSARDPKFTSKAETSAASNIQIAPSQSIFVHSNLASEISEAQIQQLKDGTIAFFHWGEIEYTDAFGDRHKVGYRLRSLKERPIDQLYFYPGGNFAD